MSAAEGSASSPYLSSRWGRGAAQSEYPILGHFCCAWSIPSQLLLRPDSHQSISIPTYPPPPSPSVPAPAPGPEDQYPCQRTSRDSGQGGLWAAGPQSPTEFVNITSEGDGGGCSTKQDLRSLNIRHQGDGLRRQGLTH